MKRLTNIPYARSGDDERALDLYVPDGDCRATIVYFHGGGLEGGSRRDLAAVMEGLAARGIAAVAPDYRMYPQNAYPDFLLDAAEAAAWTLDNAGRYGLSDRVFVGGSSAGAYLAMMLCFDGRFLRTFNRAPGDIAGYLFNSGAPLKHFNILAHEGGDPRHCRVDESSAIYHIDGKNPDRPLLFLWADDDMPCRPEQNLLMIATLRHNGYDARKIDARVMTGYKHCGYDGEIQKNGESTLVGAIMPFIEKWIGDR